jgi:hypothetical protein
MRAPEPAFASELRACRQRLGGAVGLRPDEHQLAMEILQRWEERREAAEDSWRALKNKMPDMTVWWLIRVTLDRRLAVAEELSARIPKMLKLEADIRRRAAHHRKAGKAELAAAEMAQLNEFRADRRRILSRKMNASPCRLFMVGWSGTFTELCGYPLDEVVVFLTQVAFDRDDVSVETVRDARRSTTKGGRAKNTS